MPAAFVLVNAEIGSEDEVLEDLKGTKGVVGAWIVYGVYDIVAKIEADTMDELKEIITTNRVGVLIDMPPTVIGEDKQIIMTQYDYEQSGIKPLMSIPREILYTFTCLN